MAIQTYMGSDSNDELSSMLEEFNVITSTKIKEVVAPNIIIRNLKMVVGCGCGGATTHIHAIAPKDSEFFNRYGAGGYVDSDDIRDIKRRYPEVELRKGSYSGPVSKYNPDKYGKL